MWWLKTVVNCPLSQVLLLIGPFEYASIKDPGLMEKGWGG